MATARLSMSIAWTCAAPLSASCAASRPGAAADVQAALALADARPEQVLPDQEAARGGHEDARLDHQLGHRQGIEATLLLVGPVLDRDPLGLRDRRPRAVARLRRRAVRAVAPAARHAGQALARRGDVLRAGAAAAADDVGALLAPRGREVGVLLAADAAVEGPARLGVVAEVGIDAERQVGEVAQPGDHPRDVVGRDAVDEQRGRRPSPRSAAPRGRRGRPPVRPSARRRRRTVRGGSGGSSATPGSRCRRSPARLRR